MTGEERRALRAIEQALTAEDPVLAELLREPPERRRARLLPRLRLVVITIAVIFIVLAVLLSAAALLLVGVMTLMAIPAIHRWAGLPPGPEA